MVAPRACNPCRGHTVALGQEHSSLRHHVLRLPLFPRSLRMYNGLVERCFTTCVDTFRRKTLEKTEEQVRVSLGRVGPLLSAAPAGSTQVCATAYSSTQCVTKCCEKFLKHSARVSLRFAELNAGQDQPK
jgi:Tim10/DDP family zinc finger